MCCRPMIGLECFIKSIASISKISVSQHFSRLEKKLGDILLMFCILNNGVIGCGKMSAF